MILHAMLILQLLLSVLVLVWYEYHVPVILHEFIKFTENQSKRIINSLKICGCGLNDFAFHINSTIVTKCIGISLV